MTGFGTRLVVREMLPDFSMVTAPPDLILCGKRQFRMIQQEIAAGDAERAFAGRNWRRIKREMRKARERIA